MFEKKNRFENIEAMIETLRDELGVVALKLEELEKKFNEFEKIKEKILPREFVSTIRGFETEEDYQKFHDICTDIAIKDDTFKFEGNREAKEIYIYLNDKDLLHKKSMWLIKKTNISNLKYTIR
jgi:hypothetical protein